MSINKQIFVSYSHPSRSKAQHYESSVRAKEKGIHQLPLWSCARTCQRPFAPHAPRAAPVCQRSRCRRRPPVGWRAARRRSRTRRADARAPGARGARGRAHRWATRNARRGTGAATCAPQTTWAPSSPPCAPARPRRGDRRASRRLPPSPPSCPFLNIRHEDIIEQSVFNRWENCFIVCKNTQNTKN